MIYEGLGYIYKTTNLKNNKMYIGQRLGKFTSSYLGSGLGIKRAIKVHGVDSFKVEVVCYLPTRAERDVFEKHLISKYREIIGKDNLYNMSNGGSGGNVWENLPSKENVIEKIRKARKNQIFTEETREKFRNRKWSKETNLKRSIGMKKAIAEGRKTFTNREVLMSMNKGNKHSAGKGKRQQGLLMAIHI